MLGRAVLLRLPIRQRLPLSLPSQHQVEVSSRVLFSQSHRDYAKPGRPRNVVGEPSRPVKRSVKRAAPKATNLEDSPAKQGNEARKKAAAARKSPAAKAKKQPKPRKELTEAQQAAKLARTESEKIRALKKVALVDPIVPPANAYIMFLKEYSKKGGLSGSTKDRQEQRGRLTEHSKAMAAAWKECSPADIEHYNHLAHQAKETGQADYKKWVESHTVDKIAAANRARQQLRRLEKKVADDASPHKKLYGVRVQSIHDERRVKSPISSYFQFSINRQASGDFKNITVQERAKLIGQEWKALSQEEKDKYKQLSNEETKRYKDEYTTVHGHLPPSFMAEPAAVAAAAA
ncbi:hypothetical protein LTR78_007796 [Recurvomyces mirabilis]|uniref:HMG box domain-containing protein n=1 Tax=Recurvomyces mirabilis TaxID=574656 RepID=A0AAE0WJ64_9PEZI|nr:hypothetical protein LTR78_007796 [Recurvomyces mirabilis]KAK5160162.1 hypothetical protein LTS14_002269 [Recurvomyces mirabilis]